MANRHEGLDLPTTMRFTERDRQPAYIPPTSESTADGPPMGLVVGQTGSGKFFQAPTQSPEDTEDEPTDEESN